MFVIRPIRHSDLDKLETFARATSLGMLSLPKDRNLLAQKIEHSINSFAKKPSSPGDEGYLFVMENTGSGNVGGTCGVTALSGMEDPLHFFRLETVPTPPSTLPTPKTQTILHPTTLSQGPSELGTLYLTPRWRKKGLGPLLSRSRFLFIAHQKLRFHTNIMAVLRGVISKSPKRSPFWEGLGSHFLSLNIEQVCDLLTKGRSFLCNFLPQYPIYAALLPKAAQDVMGQPHKTTLPALTMLKEEGFQKSSEIDAIEGGPMMVAVTDNVRTIKQSITATVAAVSNLLLSTDEFLISNERIDFRACHSKLQINGDGTVSINTETAAALEIDVGDTIRYVPPHPIQEMAYNG